MSKFGFDKIINELANNDIILTSLANNAKLHFVKNFEGKSFNKSPWASRKSNPYDDGHPLLEKTGKLRDAVGNPSISINNNSYTLEVNNPYGSYHNSGTGKIPKREFIGEDPELDKEQEEIINSYIKQLFR